MNIYKFNEKTLIYEPISYKKYIISIFIIFFIGISLGFSPRMIKVVEKIPIFLEKDTTDKFSSEKLKIILREMNFEHQDIVYAQAVLETSNFKSPIFRNNKNLFGMKISTSRITTHKGSELNHAKYKDWQSSVIDYAIWQSAYARNLSRKEYLTLLDKIYAEDEEYSKKLEKIIKNK